MKKLLTLSISALLSSSLLAATTEADQVKQQTAQPKYQLHLMAFDVSGKMPVQLEKKEVSRTKKQRLCWIAEGQFMPKNNVIETFTTPEATTFNVAPEFGFALSSNNNKTHTITTQRDSINEGKSLSNCWMFDEKDPLGKYKIRVKINNQAFDELPFNVVK